MTKCNKRHKARIMSLVMAASLMVDMISPSIVVSAQENDVNFWGEYETSIEGSLEDVSGDSEAVTDKNTLEEDSSEKSELTDGESASAGDLPDGSATENGEDASKEDASGDDSSSENGDASEDGKEDDNIITPEDGTETGDVTQPSEELTAEDEESNVAEVVQDETGQNPTDEEVIANSTTNNIEWKIDKNGKLSITGSGNYELDSEGHTPWYEYREVITAAEVDVTGLISAKNMFAGCGSLSSIDLSKLDTSMVTDMSGMFMDCGSLTELDLRSFDTSNVTDMSYMFLAPDIYGGLVRLDLSSFDTSKVTNMQGMFEYCSRLENLDLSNFNTSNVTDMSYMFSFCTGLKELDLSNFDTSNVTDMREMFSTCTSLIKLNLSSFNTTKVTDMSGMFLICNYDDSHITNLDLSNFDTANVTDMSRMFNGCSFKELDLSSFNTSKVTNMDEMFYHCSSLKKLDLSSFDMAAVTSVDFMFTWTYELMYIRTPINCSIDITLPVSDDTESWYDGIDSVRTTLPQNLSSSIELYKNGYPGDGTTKRMVFISGVSIEDKIYDGEPDTCVGNAVVKDADGTTLNDITVNCSYQGTLADGGQYAQTTEAPAQAGSYTLTLSIAENANYTATPSTYDFTIKKKEATITAQPVTIKAGARLPGLTVLKYDVTGLLEGDELVVQPQLKYSAEDISTSMEGSYEIIPYGADAGNNYSIKYVNGTLTIEAGGTGDETGDDTGDDEDKQTVSISGITIADKIYDAAPISYTGDAVVKDSEGNVITDVTVSTSYTGTLADSSAYAQTTDAPAQAGSYTLTLTMVENDKYTAEPVEYNFTIEQKEITITAPSVTIKTGEQLPGLTGLTCDVTGLLEGDDLAAQPQLRYSSETIETSVSGSYDIIPSDADAGNNYSIEYVNGVLTISNSNTPTYEDVDDTSYNEDERIDLNTISGTIATIKAKTYDGLPYEPVLKVTVTENGKKKTLTEGTDYRVIYKNNVDAGTTGKATVKGNGIYKGEISQTFAIKPKSIKKLKIVTGGITGSLSAADIANPLTKLPVYVYDGSVLLGRGEDYTLSIKASTDKAVTLNIAAVENTNYTGTTTAKLTIYDGTDSTTLINPEHVTVGGRKQPETYEATYTGKAIKPEVAVKIGGTDLTSKDYKVSYQNNKDAGTAYVIVTAKGQYKGKAVIPFKIVSLKSDLQITNTIKDKVYNGKLQKPPVTVKAGTAKLKKNKDYTVTYTKNLHAGTATITVTGRGNYTGKATATFNINKQNIRKVSVKVNQSGIIDVYYGKSLLRKESDYKLEFGAQKGNGKIEVTVTATPASDFTGGMTKVVKVPVYIPVLKEANQTIEKEVGETYQLQFEKPESEAVSIASIECESSNPEVASVDNNGLITIKKAGAVVIKVYANNRKSVQQCFVVVKGDEEKNLPEGKTGLTYHQKAGTTDDTKGINALLQEWEYDPELCDYVYIPAGVYRIDAVDGGIGIGGIILRDNQTLLISPSAIIMAIGNNATNSQVIYAFGRKNVTISGGQIIGERNEHQGKGGEWGHGISIQGCTNVHISNMDISQCWGDGICLGEYDTRDASGKLIHKPSDKITIENCVLHHNRRNNLSITDAKNVTINQCQFNYAKGTDPQYGICIEYNFTPTENVEIYNSTFKGNAKASMGIIKKATNVRLENCTLDGNFYNMAGTNVVLKNTTIKGDIVGNVKRE